MFHLALAWFTGNSGGVQRRAQSPFTRLRVSPVMQQVKVQGERLIELELMQQREANQNKISYEPKFEDVDRLLAHQRDGKSQAKDLIKVLSHQSAQIHELSQSVAVAHAKLADQDTIGGTKTSKGGSKSKISSAFSVTVKSPLLKSSRAGGESRRIGASPMHPRVTQNTRRTPEKTRPVAFR